MTARELHPEDRFTWERIIMRARLEGAISGSGKVSEKTGKQTRGGLSGVVFKAVALVFAAHADEDGSHIYPGDMRVAILAEVHPRTVKVVREKLIQLGMLQQTGRHGHTPMYRLTLPDDLTEKLRVLNPDEVGRTAKEMRAKTRDAKAKSRAKSVDGCSAGTPKAEAKGAPAVHPNGPDGDPDGCSAGTPQIANGCTAGQDMGVPPDTLNHVRTGQLLHQPSADEDLRTAVTGEGVAEAVDAKIISFPASSPITPARNPRPSRADAARQAIAEASARRAAAIAAQKQGATS